MLQQSLTFTTEHYLTFKIYCVIIFVPPTLTIKFSHTEEEDRDVNCVVSSLVQIMLDPYYRTLIGFQSLVQKEWVMAGHRFLERCNHLKKNDKEEVFFLNESCHFVDESAHIFWNSLSYSLLFFVLFIKVPNVHIVPGLRVADDEPVPSGIWVLRGLSDSTEWQHVGPTLQYFPLQFS